MSGVNKVILLGRVGKDPEIRNLPNGDSVASLTIATSDKWKDKQTGENKEKTEWHRLVMFKRLAEIVGQYIHKGSLIYVEGKLQTRKWTDDKGQERYTTEIKCNDMRMLDSKGENQQQSPQNNQKQNKQQQQPNQNYQQQGAKQGQGTSQQPQAGQYNKQAAQQAPDLDDGWDDDIPF